MTEQTKIKKKVDLGAIAFVKVNRLAKELAEMKADLNKLEQRIPSTPEIRDNGVTI